MGAGQYEIMIKYSDLIDKKVLLLPEIGLAHEGSLGLAYAYIDAVAEVGAQAVKFQTHFAEEESSLDEPWRVKFSKQDETRWDYWKRMEFSEDQWCEIAKYCHKIGLLFISSPFSIKAVDVLIKSKIDAWKIASGELTNILMLERIAQTGLPVIISSGMSDFKELDRIVDFFKKSGNEICILQCTSNYPVEPQNIGLNLLDTYRKRYHTKVGLSDHSGNIFSGLMAASWGANIIEVHLTFHKKMFGPDVKASITAEQLKELIEGVSWISKAIRNPVSKNEIFSEFKQLRKIFLKSVVSRKLIKKGEIISKKDIVLKKPLKGIPADKVYEVIGKQAKVNIKPNIFITKKHLE